MERERSTAPEQREGEYVLGLLADPGIPSRIASWLQQRDRLADRLRQATGDRWRIEVTESQLPLDPDGNLPLLALGRDAMSTRHWDVAVIVTDLPRRAEWVPVLADYSTDSSVGMLSVPALGALRTRQRAMRAISHLVAEHLNPRRDTRGRPIDEESSRARRIRAPLGHIDSSHEGVDEHIALLGVRGRVRLLVGMVRANRPWRLLPSLSPAMAGAAAGAAFGVFYSNVWLLADAFSTWRMLLVAVLAIVAMIFWLIADNGLWERPSDLGSPERAVIANTATATTIASAVLSMYLLLFLATLVAAYVVIPGSHLETQLGHTVGFPDYVGLAWLSTSMGTIAGALGSGLADEEAVKQAAYSRREYQRRQRRESAESADGADGR